MFCVFRPEVSSVLFVLLVEIQLRWFGFVAFLLDLCPVRVVDDEQIVASLDAALVVGLCGVHKLLSLFTLSRGGEERFRGVDEVQVQHAVADIEN
jgi:hypothetical protein